MLNRLHIRRIRSILDEYVPLAPATIIVGHNGAGKSNIIRSIFLCSRVAKLLLEGPAGQSKKGSLPIELFPKEELYAYGYAVLREALIKLEMSSLDGKLSGDFTISYRPEAPKLGVAYRAKTSSK